MKFLMSALLLLPLLFASAPALAMFTGDTKLACEAVLCLSSGKRPSDCRPALSRYFGISHKKFSDTLKSRKNFLRLCPSSDQTPEMSSLVEAVTNGAGRCDSAALNAELLVVPNQDLGCSFVRQELPSYCSAYNNHSYSNVSPPRYVGSPEYGGFWVEAEKYDKSIQDYEKHLPEEKIKKLRDCPTQ